MKTCYSSLSDSNKLNYFCNTFSFPPHLGLFRFVFNAKQTFVILPYTVNCSHIDTGSYTCAAVTDTTGAQIVNSNRIMNSYCVGLSTTKSWSWREMKNTDIWCLVMWWAHFIALGFANILLIAITTWPVLFTLQPCNVQWTSEGDVVTLSFPLLLLVLVWH